MKYFIKRGEKDWEEVTKEVYVREERREGFTNTMNEPEEPATSAFYGPFVWGKTEGILL